jgi:hypothetical protein
MVCIAIFDTLLCLIFVSIVITVLIWDLEQRMRIGQFIRNRLTRRGRRHQREMYQYEQELAQYEQQQPNQAPPQRHYASGWSPSSGCYFVEDDGYASNQEARHQNLHKWQVLSAKLIGLIVLLLLFLSMLTRTDELCMSRYEIDHPELYQSSQNDR